MKKILIFLLVVSPFITASAQTSIWLNTPNDEDTIYTIYPVLTWNYSEVPLSNGRVFYEFKLVEVLAQQSRADAIISNAPLLNFSGFIFSFLNYPFDAPRLEEGKTYAWQIKKISDNAIVSESDIYQFYIFEPTVPPRNYVYLKKKNDGSIFSVKDQTFSFRYDEAYINHSIGCELINLKTKQKVNCTLSNSGETHVGVNFFDIDLSNCSLGLYEVRIVEEGKISMTTFINKL